MNVVREQRTRLEVAVEWAVWHFAELAGVLVPLGFALVLPGVLATLAWVLAGLVGAVWTVREVRLSKEQKDLRIGAAERREQRQLAAASADADTVPAAHEHGEGA